MAPKIRSVLLPRSSSPLPLKAKNYVSICAKCVNNGSRSTESHGLTAILKDKQGLDTIPKKLPLHQNRLKYSKKKAKEGFTRITLVPRGTEAHLVLLKEKLVDGLEKDSNGEPIEAFLNDYEDKRGEKSSFPPRLKTTDPPCKDAPYLLLTNPDQPFTQGPRTRQLMPYFPSSKPSVSPASPSMTSSLKNAFTSNQNTKTSRRLGTQRLTWLLPLGMPPPVCLMSWHPGNHWVRVVSDPSGSSNPILGPVPRSCWHLNLDLELL